MLFCFDGYSYDGIKWLYWWEGRRYETWQEFKRDRGNRFDWRSKTA